MQRQASTTRATELPQSLQPRSLLFSPKGKMEETAHLPLYIKDSSVSKKEVFKSRMAEKLVHLIPLVVLLCFFILWCFSYSVNFDSKDGWITSAYRLMAQNATFVHLTFSPNSSISGTGMQILSNESYAEFDQQNQELAANGEIFQTLPYARRKNEKKLIISCCK